MNLTPILIREVIIKAIREFFYRQKFHEMITPVLNKAIPLEPNIYPFQTIWLRQNNSRQLFLSTSPEAYIKKMIAGGIGNCFAIGKSFRNLEDSGPFHSPEFLMLEWYRENTDCKKIIKDTIDLIKFIKNKVDKYLGLKPNSILSYQKNKIDLSGKWQIYSLVDLFNKFAGCKLEELINDNKMIEVSEKKGYSTNNATWEQLFNQIFLNEIEPKIPLSPCFITDFPARISPLCAVKQDNKNLADRFEFYLARIELANGNKENTDVESIKKIFIEEANYKKREKIPVPPLDKEFFKALNIMKAKNYAGVGMGIDRLTMLFADVNNICTWAN